MSTANNDRPSNQRKKGLVRAEDEFPCANTLPESCSVLTPPPTMSSTSLIGCWVASKSKSLLFSGEKEKLK